MWTNDRLEVELQVIACGYVIALCSSCMSGLGFCVGDAFVCIMVSHDEARREETRRYNYGCVAQKMTLECILRIFASR